MYIRHVATVHGSVEIKLISMACEIQHNRQEKNKHNEH